MGVYTEIDVTDPRFCRLLEMSGDAELTVLGRTQRGDETWVTAYSPTDDVRADSRRICRTQNGMIHQFEATGFGRCPCDLLADFERSYSAIRAQGARLNVGIFTEQRERLERLVDRCRSLAGSVEVRRLLDARTVQFRGRGHHDVDSLTDRQREVLAAAYDIGYYSAPRESNLTDVADRLDIHRSTARQHLVAAESKIVADLFDEGPG